MKEAIYSGSRNLYPHMATAAKSLIANSPVDRVWFLIEDEEFPIEVPDMVRTIDVSGQQYFNPNGPNMKTQFTYMALMRVCYAKLLPETDKVLQLDVVNSGGKNFAHFRQRLRWMEPCSSSTFLLPAA